MAKKSKVGLKVPTKNEILKKYGGMMRLASETVESNLWLPSTFFALNYTFGGGIPFGKILEVAGEESSGKSLLAYDFEDGIEFVRETYYIFKFTKQDEESISNIYNELRNISKNEFIENFKIIYSHKINQEYAPGITEEFASSMFDNVSRDLFIKIFELIRSHESYYNGWPDLTLISNVVLKLIEIKTTDKLHDSQIKTIPMLTEKLGIDVSVLKLDN